jgi:hypothetical protein
MKPKYPIYIISKGRWERRQTVKTMEFTNTPYKIVVEPKEYNDYANVIDEKNIIKAPENFSERGQGSVPVRNFVWQHSIDNGFDWHWILDDNIESVERFYNNLKIKCKTSTPFRIIEHFVDRYENIGQAGMHYGIFCPASEARPPLHFNTRVYSCILQNNKIKHRWRGKYNEDTDLSLRILKDGWVTVLFRTFLIGKRATSTQKGGNADIYSETDNRLEFAQSLVDQHPDVVKLTKKFNRFHHQVNYKPFADNDLIFKKGIHLKNENNDYGLALIKNEATRNN